MAISHSESSGGVVGTATTSWSVTMPTTKSGCLVILLSVDGPPSSVSWPAGWDVIIDDTDGDLSGHGLYVAARNLDNTEGSSITVTMGSSQNGTWCWQRWADTGSSADIEFSDPLDSGTDTSPDPPNLTPSGGSQEYAWIAFCGSDNSNADITGDPTSYSTGEVHRDWIDNGFSAIAHSKMVGRILTASSENPSAFTQSFTFQHGAGTLAVPSPSAAGLPSFRAMVRGMWRAEARGMG